MADILGLLFLLKLDPERGKIAAEKPFEQKNGTTNLCASVLGYPYIVTILLAFSLDDFFPPPPSSSLLP